MDTGHALLGVAVDLPESDGVVLTGRLSLGSQPWLADHSVLGSVLMPGTALAEMALRAGDEVGCDLLEELTVAAPLMLPESGAVVVRVAVDAELDGAAGRRSRTRTPGSSSPAAVDPGDSTLRRR